MTKKLTDQLKAELKKEFVEGYIENDKVQKNKNQYQTT